MVSNNIAVVQEIRVSIPTKTLVLINTISLTIY